MNRKIIIGLLTSAFLFALLGMGGNKSESASAPVLSSNEAKPRIGVVEISRLYQESKIGLAGVDHFSRLQTTALAQLQQLQADYQTAVEAEDEAKAQRLQIELQGMAYAFQAMMDNEQETAIAMLSATVKQAMDQYLAENNLQIIMTNDSVQSFAAELEITDAVLALLNTFNFDYGPGPDFSLPSHEDDETHIDEAPTALPE